jgi:endonuclease IV
LEILFTPGHSPGSITFYNREEKFMIAGDVLFYGSIGRTDLPGGNYETLINNIKTKLLLETPAGQGTELLKDFNDFINFYYSFTETEREYFKICIDTCHVWNAGYELREIIALVPDKNDIVCVHINNSKNEKGAKVDRHEFIFEGKINPNDLKCFSYTFDKSIIIIEKPSPNYDKEITFLSNN